MDANSENVTNEDDSSSFVALELEALQSIYINEIEVKNDTNQVGVSIDLHPATADNVEEQYVRLTLKFLLKEDYPQSVPEITIRNPRGLSDEKLNSVMEDLVSIAESKVGSSMLFEIIEAAKEHLTIGNRPCGECAICLFGFSEEDVFTKTECYHYFHSHCLARYSNNSLAAAALQAGDESANADTKGLLCPMCRLPIHFEGSEELFPPPAAGDDELILTEEISNLQKKMAELFQKQVEKGGIIDVEAERNKYLLEISNVPTRVNTLGETPTSNGNGTLENDVTLPQEEAMNGEEEAGACATSPPSNPKKSAKQQERKSPRDGEKYNRSYDRYPRNSNGRDNSYRTNTRYDSKNKNKFASESNYYEDSYDRGSYSGGSYRRPDNRGGHRKFRGDWINRGNYRNSTPSYGGHDRRYPRDTTLFQERERSHSNRNNGRYRRTTQDNSASSDCIPPSPDSSLNDVMNDSPENKSVLSNTNGSETVEDNGVKDAADSKPAKYQGGSRNSNRRFWQQGYHKQEKSELFENEESKSGRHPVRGYRASYDDDDDDDRGSARPRNSYSEKYERNSRHTRGRGSYDRNYQNYGSKRDSNNRDQSSSNGGLEEDRKRPTDGDNVVPCDSEKNEPDATQKYTGDKKDFSSNAKRNPYNEGGRHQERGRYQRHYRNNYRHNDDRHSRGDGHENRRRYDNGPPPRRYSGEKYTRSHESHTNSPPSSFEISQSDPVPVVPKENVRKSESASKDVSATPVDRSMPPPPPGFSNPLKKVVYGLQAANPPPGFPSKS